MKIMARLTQMNQRRSVQPALDERQKILYTVNRVSFVKNYIERSPVLREMIGWGGGIFCSSGGTKHHHHFVLPLSRAPLFSPFFPHFHNALTTVATLGYPECGFLGGYPEFF